MSDTTTTNAAAANAAAAATATMEERRFIDGDRICLLFGKTGADWLLILNEDDDDDDGNHRVRQSMNWSSSSASSSESSSSSSSSSDGGTVAASGIPNRLLQRLDIIKTEREYDVTSVDFGPTGGWFVQGRHRTTDEYFCWYIAPSPLRGAFGR
jgi:hypothetical protein